MPLEPTSENVSWPQYRELMEASAALELANAKNLRKVASYVRSNDHRGLDLYKAGLKDPERNILALYHRHLAAREEYSAALKDLRDALLVFSPGERG